MWRTGVAAFVAQVADDAGRRQPRCPGDRLRGARRRRRNEMRDLPGIDSGATQRGGDGARQELQMPLVADPALLERVIELAPRLAVLVDEVGGERRVPDQLRDEARTAPDERGRGAVAVCEFRGAAGWSAPAVGRDDERVVDPPAVERREQRSSPRAAGRGEIDRRAVFAQIERSGGHACVGAIGERQGGRGEADPADGAAIDVAEAVACCFDGHRDAVLVPVAERAASGRWRAARAPPMRSPPRSSYARSAAAAGTRRRPSIPAVHRPRISSRSSVPAAAGPAGPPVCRCRRA